MKEQNYNIIILGKQGSNKALLAREIAGNRNCSFFTIHNDSDFDVILNDPFISLGDVFIIDVECFDREMTKAVIATLITMDYIYYRRFYEQEEIKRVMPLLIITTSELTKKDFKHSRRSLKIFELK